MMGQDSTPIVLRRNCKAVVIPAGFEIELNKNELVYITQAMGGSFTVYFEGSLFRIAGKDADALGLEPEPAPKLPENATKEDFEKLIWDQIRTCYDPEIPINVVDLGLIYGIEVDDTDPQALKLTVHMTLTAAGCGMGEVLVEDVHDKVSIIPTVADVQVDLIFDPPWSQEMMSEAAKLEAGLL
ncbi:MAG: putative FeS assembly SUF system protein SufT [Gammaproteobacteria bacterium]|jgi:probable FeS assembly SUF system protein SufT|tara:strand:- start:40 stop:591 length:552 start_codon:yes stop_codon:yes gene_type:complete